MVSRRDVLIGGSLLLAAGCGDPLLPEDEYGSLDPAACWEGDDEMASQASPYTNPLVLYGSTVVQPNSDGVIPNSLLANPNGMPMEILEIRFRLVPQVNFANMGATVTGMGVGLKMDIGKVPVVNAYTPIGIFGSTRDSYEDQWAVLGNTQANGIAYGVFQSGYSWRLKYPLFVPTGSSLSCVCRALGQNAFPVRIDVVYVARTWDVRRALPTTVKTPWASSYNSKVFLNVTSEPSKLDASTPLDISNPFDTPLEVARFGGRVSVLYNIPAWGSDSVLEEPVQFREFLTTLQMRSSRGFDIIRTPTSFGNVFPYAWRVWDVPSKWNMAPGEFYKAQFSVGAVAGVIPAERQGQVQFSLGVVGYRNVPVGALVGV